MVVTNRHRHERCELRVSGRLEALKSDIDRSDASIKDSQFCGNFHGLNTLCETLQAADSLTRKLVAFETLEKVCGKFVLLRKAVIPFDVFSVVVRKHLIEDLKKDSCQ